MIEEIKKLTSLIKPLREAANIKDQVSGLSRKNRILTYVFLCVFEVSKYLEEKEDDEDDDVRRNLKAS